MTTLRRFAIRSTMCFATTFACTAAAAAQFGSQQPVRHVSGARQFVLHDVNGDGALDAIVNRGVMISVLDGLGLRGPVFGPARDLSMLPSTSPRAALSVTDVDVDGIDDLMAVETSFPPKVTWFRGDGSGGFAPEQAVATIPRMITAWSEDMDGDGDSDLVAIVDGLFSSSWDELHILENDGAGTFTEAATIPLGAGLGRPHRHDVDGDGVLDIVYTTFGSQGALSWRRNLGGWTLGDSEQLLTSAGYLTLLDLADVNGDSRPDAVVRTSANDDVVMLPGMTQGFGGQQLLIQVGSSGGVVLADVDRDADMDVVLGRFYSDRVEYALNDGAGALGGWEVVDGYKYRVSHFHVGDLDRDGVQDLLSHSGGTFYVNWGTWTLGSTYCSGQPGSSTNPVTLSVTGSARVADAELKLTATGLAANTVGIFLTSTTQGNVANPGGSLGSLCLGGAIGRYVGAGQVQTAGLSGRNELEIDAGQRPSPTGFLPVLPGQTWSFQSWFRVAGSGGQASSAFSTAVAVTFR